MASISERIASLQSSGVLAPIASSSSAGISAQKQEDTHALRKRLTQSESACDACSKLHQQVSVCDAALRDSIIKAEKLRQDILQYKKRLSAAAEEAMLLKNTVQRLEAQVAAGDAAMINFAKRARDDRDDAVADARKQLREENYASVNG